MYWQFIIQYNTCTKCQMSLCRDFLIFSIAFLTIHQKHAHVYMRDIYICDCDEFVYNKNMNNFQLINAKRLDFGIKLKLKLS